MKKTVLRKALQFPYLYSKYIGFMAYIRRRAVCEPC